MTVDDTLLDGAPKTAAGDDAAVNAGNDRNLASFFRTLAHGRDGDVWGSERYFGFLSGVPHPFFNGVVSSRLPESGLDACVASILAPFRERRVPALWWTSSAPASLRDALQRHGLQPRDPAPIMGRSLDDLPEAPPPHPDLALIRVDSQERLRTYCELWAGVYGLKAHLVPSILNYLGCAVAADSPMRHYVAYWRGEAVGTSTLHCGGGVAGLYNVGTTEAARGRGVGTALTRLALHEARVLGYHVIILQASEMGFPIYERLGFRTTGQMVQYLLAP